MRTIDGWTRRCDHGSASAFVELLDLDETGLTFAPLLPVGIRFRFAILVLDMKDRDACTRVLIVTVDTVYDLLAYMGVVEPHDAGHRVLSRAQELRRVGSNDGNPRRALLEIARRGVVRLRSRHAELDVERDRRGDEFATGHRFTRRVCDDRPPHLRLLSAGVDDDDATCARVSECGL